MLDADPAFRPIRLLGGYPSLEDLLDCADHPLGLLSEQVDPSTGELNGNFPQAFSHIGVIASGVTLEQATGAAR